MRRKGCLKWASLFVVLGMFAYFTLKGLPSCGLNGRQWRQPRSHIDDLILEESKRETMPLRPPKLDEKFQGNSKTNDQAQAKIIDLLRRKQETLLQQLHDAKKQEEDLKRKLIKLSREVQVYKNRDKPSSASTVLPTIFVITPTFKRFVQKAELTRVSQALKPVKDLHWIVVEDSQTKTKLVTNFLSDSGIKYTHLNIRTPENLQRRRHEYRKLKPRGVVQRNAGIEWLRNNINPNRTPGVVYFADDDNTYDSRIFNEMRWIRGVGVWPVAFTGAVRWAGPVCRNGHVTGFHTKWGLFRPFPIDMAAFAINIKKLILEFPKAKFVAEPRAGMLESSLLSQITTVKDLEPVTPNCSKVYVWHTRTEVPKDSILGEKELIRRGKPSNRDIET